MAPAKDKTSLSAKDESSPPAKDESSPPAKDESSPPAKDESSPSSEQKISPTVRIFGLTLLTAFSIELTKLCLSPVYGSSSTIPYPFSSEVNLIILVFITNNEAPPALQSRLISLTPILGCALPTILSHSFQFSSHLGPSWGPLLTSLVTVLPLTYLSLLQNLQDNLTVAKQTPDLLSSLGPYPNVPLLLAAWGTLYGFRRVAAFCLQFEIENLGGAAVSTRFGMQVILSVVFAAWACNRRHYWAVGLTVLSVLNVHLPAVWNDERLYGVLEREGYALVARRESVTGYISVLDNLKEGFRVMRCDHSLLGGEWLKQEVGSRLREPVYAIFVMLEAVRLVRTKISPPKADVDAKALVIGLGVGTSPAAFVAHGIQTTSIEIDPVVHKYATKYFDLPAHNSIIADAIPTVKTLRNGTYDYIIHDVFTGGVEPLELFTHDFLDNLKGLLHDQGTIAINYAGDILLPTAKSVVATILAVFPTCRIFRESEPIGSGQDFTNLVVFCRKAAGETIDFREPTTADFLGSGARKEFLKPQLEVDASDMGVDKDTHTVDAAVIKALARSQEKSRVGHWQVMRGVMPDVVWENW